VRIFRVKGQAGFTLIELIISLALTGIIAFTAFKFYASLNQQALSQQEISDIQQTNRACLEELSTALRSAGSGLTTSPAYAVSNDSLSVYMQAAGGAGQFRDGSALADEAGKLVSRPDLCRLYYGFAVHGHQPQAGCHHDRSTNDQG